MNYGKSWASEIDDGIYKYLAKISRKDGERILKVIADLTNDPFIGDIEKIKGEKDLWRRRVGSYRILYELYRDLKIIHVTNVERHGSKTYSKKR